MKQLEDYWVFDITRFILDYPLNKQRLNEKREELKEITQVKSPNLEYPPGTPGRGDCVASAVERKECLEKEIKQLERITSAYEGAYRTLNKEEKKTLDHLSLSIEAVKDKTCYSERQIYRQRKALKRKFKKMLCV